MNLDGERKGGPRERIRTYDLRIRSPTLYPAELRAGTKVGRISSCHHNCPELVDEFMVSCCSLAGLGIDWRHNE